MHSINQTIDTFSRPCDRVIAWAPSKEEARAIADLYKKHCIHVRIRPRKNIPPQPSYVTMPYAVMVNGTWMALANSAALAREIAEILEHAVIVHLPFGCIDRGIEVQHGPRCNGTVCKLGVCLPGFHSPASESKPYPWTFCVSERPHLEASHGNIVVRQYCQCGKASRLVEVNGNHWSAGEWRVTGG